MIFFPIQLFFCSGDASAKIRRMCVHANATETQQKCQTDLWSKRRWGCFTMVYPEYDCHIILWALSVLTVATPEIKTSYVHPKGPKMAGGSWPTLRSESNNFYVNSLNIALPYIYIYIITLYIYI